MKTKGIQTLKFAISSSFGTNVGILQSRDHTIKSDIKEVRDQTGEIVAVGYYNINEESTWEFLVTGSAILRPGDVVTVTDADYTAVTGSNWIVDEWNTKGSIEDYLKGTVKLRKHAAITS